MIIIILTILSTPLIETQTQCLAPPLTMHASITGLLKISTVTEKRQQHPRVLASLRPSLKRMISQTQLVKEVCFF